MSQLLTSPGFTGGPRGLTLLQAIQQAGLTTNLKLALDAGDIASWSGSGQKWLDRSGGGYDLFLGADGTVSTDDPTFSGTPGGLSGAEYWSFDGGDFFRYDTANEAWMNALHQDSALFTLLLVIWPGSVGTAFGLAGTASALTSQVGFGLDLGGANNFRFAVGNGSASLPLDVHTDAAVPAGAWSMLALSVDEAAGSGFFWRNGAYVQVAASDTFTATYTSPSAAGAANTLELCARGGAAAPVPSGTRFAAAAAWQGTALTKVQLDSLFALLRGRWGL